MSNQITVVVQKAQRDLASGVVFAGTTIAVTDRSGAALPPVKLDGTETPPWTAVFTGADGDGAASAVITDVDSTGAAIGKPVTVSEAQFPASVGATISVA